MLKGSPYDAHGALTTEKAMYGKGLLGLFGLSVLFGTNVLGCSGGGDPAPAPAPAPATAGSPADAPSAPDSPAPGPVASTDPTPAPPPTPIGRAKLAPEQLGSRLALWLLADDGVDAAGSNVTKWKDRSGNGNDAVTMGMPPATLAATGIGGKPSIHFPGGTAYLNVPDSASLHFGTDDVSAFIVFAQASDLAPYSRILIAKTDTAYPYTGLGFYANVNNTYGLGAAVRYPSPIVTLDTMDPAVYAQSKATLAIAKRAGGDAIAILSGAKSASATALVNQTPVDISNSAGLRIGGQGGSEQALTGDIAEIVLVHGSMTTNEANDVTSYLTAKYGL